jgi:diaminopimelate epimerase
MRSLQSNPGNQHLHLFLDIIDSGNIRIEIWERGAGYTLASGSSSTAAAAVAYKLGFCDPAITVHMPGGELAIKFSKGFSATMTGPVTRVCECSCSKIN